MEFRNYYKIMEVARDVTQDEIRRAYRKQEGTGRGLRGAEGCGKTRSLRPQLGARYQGGQEFRPPPDWNAGFEFSGGDAADYSDFFASLFGRDSRSLLLYWADGRDLYLDFPVTLWEAALGATVKVPTLGGVEELKIPSGFVSGRKMRQKARGMPGDPPGDCYVILSIALTSADTEAAKDLYRKMEYELDFNPCAGLGV
jgi:DnaJ-class molecular chaperone